MICRTSLPPSSPPSWLPSDLDIWLLLKLRLSDQSLVSTPWPFTDGGNTRDQIRATARPDRRTSQRAHRVRITCSYELDINRSHVELSYAISSETTWKGIQFLWATKSFLRCIRIWKCQLAHNPSLTTLYMCVLRPYDEKEKNRNVWSSNLARMWKYWKLNLARCIDFQVTASSRYHVDCDSCLVVKWKIIKIDLKYIALWQARQAGKIKIKYRPTHRIVNKITQVARQALRRNNTFF